jgi:OPA family sugar phosphate sensor protein UhpC-like MFS transporter
MGIPANRIFDFFRTGPDRPLDSTEPTVIRRKYERMRSGVFLSVTFGYGIFYVGRINLSVVKKPLIDEGILSATELGIIGSALLITYAVGKLVNGFLADRANIRRFMAFGLLMVAAINLFLGANTVFVMFAMLWALNGWVQATGAPGSIVSLSQWFSQRERGTRYGIWCISHNIGEVVTFIMTAFLVSHMGWRWGFWGPGLVCALSGLVLLRTLADRPQTYGLPSVADYKDDPAPASAPNVPVGNLQREVLRNPAVWVLGLGSACMYVARYGMNNWGVLYLQGSKHYSIIDAGTIMGIYAFAGLAGSFMSGIISDRYFQSRRNLPCLLAGILQVVSLLAVFLIPPGNLLLDALALTVFGFAMGILISFLGGLMAIDIVAPRAAGAASGVVGLFSYIGASIQNTTSGWLIDEGRSIGETVVPVSPRALCDFLESIGVDLTGIVGPGAIDAVREVTLYQANYDFDKVFFFWLGASVLSMLLPLFVWNAAKRAKERYGAPQEGAAI